jgi:hypothetical protein
MRSIGRLVAHSSRQFAIRAVADWSSRVHAFQVGEPVFLVVRPGCAERAAGVPASARTVANGDN